MSTVKREQLRDAESSTNTRQDRNMFATGGGAWTWDAGTGTLSWGQGFQIQSGSGAVASIAGPSSSVVGTASGSTLYVDISRTTSLTVPAVGGLLITDSAFASDYRVVVGVRGADGKFYFRNGTVMSDGDSKQFGTLNSVVDRVDIVADGLALQTVGFTYLTGKNQLQVYVGGLLQELTVAYVETSSTQMTFQAGHIPGVGETVTFINGVGGQGPAATGTVSLQDAWAVGRSIDVSSGNGLQLSGSVGQQVLYTLNPATGLPTYSVVGTTGMTHNMSGVGGYTFDSNVSTYLWGLVPANGGDGALLFMDNGSTNPGLRVTSSGQLEFGSYAGAYPAGAWSGSGGIKWSVYVGTLSAGAATVVATGLPSIMGVVFSVHDAVTGMEICHEAALGATASKAHAVFFDSATGDVTIAGTSAATGSTGQDVDGEAYSLVVFHA